MSVIARTHAIDFLVSDIDGTLVTGDKTLTPAAATAVARLAGAGVAFSLISSRPPRGMAALVTALGVTLPFAAFNGGAIVRPDGFILGRHVLPGAIVARTLSLLAGEGVDAWVFAGDAWWLHDPAGANVARERRTVGFDPVVVADLAAARDVGKIVGTSDDHARLAFCEAKVAAALGKAASVGRSQPYYLDITHPRATKGRGVAALCRLAGFDLARTAVIGDMENDVSMFHVAGLAIAMGQAPDEVKARAGFVTASNADEGFAQAVDRFVLPRAA
ncbi:MAG: Cof-type HAD-IIB family hydrolase [Caulobacteraceae bacterium]